MRQALAAVLPEGALVTTPESIERYSHDEAEWAPYVPALAVVRPRTAQQVQAVVRVCLEHRVPVVPRGAGTGLSGGANATAGSVVVSLAAMDAVLAIRHRRAVRRRAARRHQRPPAGRGRRARALVTAGEAVTAVTRSGVTPSALELLDRHCLKAVNDWKNLGLEAAGAGPPSVSAGQNGLLRRLGTLAPGRAGARALKGCTS